jgi:hypothetical protein
MNYDQKLCVKKKKYSVNKMVTLNINFEKKKKEKLNKIIQKTDHNTISSFVRDAIEEKIKVEEIFQNTKEELEIPDYVPDGKYVAIVRNTIVGIGDSPSELVMNLSSKFIEDSIRIKKKGQKHVPLEYVFLAEKNLNCWQYLELEGKSYPVIPFSIEKNGQIISGRAMPDSAASLTLIDEKIVKKLNLQPKKVEKIFSIDGIKELPVYELELNLVEFQKQVDVLGITLSEKFPFQILLGRNLLDFLDVYFFGRKQVICFKPS